MRITHVNFARGFRGGERQTLNLIEALAHQGFEQTLVCRPGSELAVRAAHLGVLTRLVCHPALGHRLPPADLIHVHEARGAYWAALEHLLHKTPYVITRRIPVPLSRSRTTRAVYRRAAALFGVSQDVSARLATQTDRQVTTILSCASFHPVHPKRVQAIRAGLGGSPVIGHVGVLHDAHKGQSVLIAAFHRLARSFAGARLLLVGDGPDRAALERLAGGDPRIVFAGLQQDVGSYLAAMDVFAFPSREEGLGSSVLDAMVLGIPVVVSAAGGLPELVGANERGLLAEPLNAETVAECIARLLRGPSLRARLTGAASAFARRHDAAAMASGYAACYRAILRGKRHDFGGFDSGRQEHS